MFDSNAVKKLIIEEELKQSDVVLLFIALNNEATTIFRLKELAFETGRKELLKWNLSRAIKALGRNIVELEEGYELTQKGKNYLLECFPSIQVTSATNPIERELKQLLADIDDKQLLDFVNEVLICISNNCYSSAIVLSWVGAIYILQNFVYTNKLVEFNSEATKRNSKWKDVKGIDDFGRVKEYDFLQILVAISLIGKNTKQELEGCLKLRNSCGHPTSLVVGEYRVISHVEILIENVYKKFV